MQSRVRPVVICGGSGSRLWPASRSTYPKQFISLLGERSLLQATVNRLRHITDEKPMLVANYWHRFLIKHQLDEIGVRDFELVLELEGRNTAPAIALAAFTMRGDQGDPILLVLPSDHYIGKTEALAAAVENGAALAEAGYLVTFGIKPERAETGYGYIRCGAPVDTTSGGYAIERFIEKPNAESAKEYLRTPGYLWNSGIFMFRAGRYLEELQKFRPDIYAAVEKSVRLGQWDQEAFLTDGASFQETPDDSIDYAVMEKPIARPSFRSPPTGRTSAPGRRSGKSCRRTRKAMPCRATPSCSTAPTAWCNRSRAPWPCSACRTWSSSKPVMPC